MYGIENRTLAMARCKPSAFNFLLPKFEWAFDSKGFKRWFPFLLCLSSKQ